MLVEQIREGKHRVDNAYPRAVSREGNVKAKKIMYRSLRALRCRVAGVPGHPAVPGSGSKRSSSEYDAQKKFGIVYRRVSKHSACICDRVLRGIAQPTDCKLFGKVCTPDTGRALHGQSRGRLQNLAPLPGKKPVIPGDPLHLYGCTQD